MLANVIATLYSAAANAAAAPEAKAAALTLKKVEPTTIDKLGAIAAMTVIGTALLVLAITAGWMIYKALTQPQSLQTSWNQAQEEQFQSYAEIETRIHKRAWTFAFVGALLMAVVSVGVYFGVTPKKDKTAESMDMSTFDKKSKAPEAPAQH